jgi:hypothetical protein
MATVNKPLLDHIRGKGLLWDKQHIMSFDMAKIAPPETQIFVLSPEVALAAETLVRSKSFKMPKPAEMRFPYPQMAIEVPLTPEVKALRASGMEGTFPINRIGAYIQSNHEAGWINCSAYWGYENANFVEPPVFSFVYGSEDLPALSVGVHAPGNPNEVAVFKVMPSYCMLEACARHGVPPQNVSNIFRQPETNTAIGESVSELPTLLFACVLLLNCKSGVRHTKIAAQTPPTGLKLGAKKRKEMSASSYTLLHLDELEEVSADGTIRRRSDVSAHYVRGHFKQRKSGIYWWNSFIRGSGELRRREAYVVEE